MSLNKNKEASSKNAFTIGKLFRDGTIIDELYDPKTNRYQFALSKGGSISVVDEYTDPTTNIRYIPMKDKSIENGDVLLPTDVYSGTIDPMLLVNRLEKFLIAYMDVETGFDKIVARAIMVTWFSDVFEKIAYIRMLGSFSSGKSRFLDLVTVLSRNAINVGNMSDASIYRLLDKYPGATLLFDEANFENTLRTSNLVKILNSGYDRNGKVVRSDNKTLEPIFYPTYGSKFLACNFPFADIALDSRIISSIAYQTQRKDIPEELPPFQEWPEATELRNMLLKYRLENLMNVKNNTARISLEGYDLRLREISKSLFRVTGETKLPPEIKKFFDQISQDRVMQAQQTEDGIVTGIMLDYWKMGDNIVTPGEIAKKAGENGCYMSSKTAANVMRTLGIPANHRSNRGFYAKLDKNIVERLARRYKYSI